MLNATFLFVDIDEFHCPDLDNLNGSVFQEFMKIVWDLMEVNESFMRSKLFLRSTKMLRSLPAEILSFHKFSVPVNRKETDFKTWTIQGYS
jgi:hypothetical protein